MAYTRKPVYQFKTVDDLGINEVPINRLSIIEATAEIYLKINNNNLDNDSTIQDAIDGGNLKNLSSDAINSVESGVEHRIDNAVFISKDDYDNLDPKEATKLYIII